jgi:hypothetical protein
MAGCPLSAVGENISIDFNDKRRRYPRTKACFELAIVRETAFPVLRDYGSLAG